MKHTTPGRINGKIQEVAIYRDFCILAFILLIEIIRDGADYNANDGQAGTATAAVERKEERRDEEFKKRG